MIKQLEPGYSKLRVRNLHQVKSVGSDKPTYVVVFDMLDDDDMAVDQRKWISRLTMPHETCQWEFLQLRVDQIVHAAVNAQGEHRFGDEPALRKILDPGDYKIRVLKVSEGNGIYLAALTIVEGPEQKDNWPRCWMANIKSQKGSAIRSFLEQRIEKIVSAHVYDKRVKLASSGEEIDLRVYEFSDGDETP